jgi:tetratricopeptide (TPR) repeat protein
MSRVALSLALLVAAPAPARGPSQERPAPLSLDEAAVRRAIQELRRGKDEETNVALLHDAVERASDAGRFARDVGALLLRERLYEQAQRFLEIARERLPEDGFVAQQLGNAHVMQHHYAEAYEHLLAAEKLLPPGPHPLVQQYLSMVLIGLQKAEESEERARREIEEARAWNATQPAGATRLDEADFALNLANVYQKFLRPDDALKVLDGLDEETTERRDRAKARLLRAEILDAKGDEAGALLAFEGQRELAPDDPVGAYAVALFHVRRNRPAQARPWLEDAVKLDPDHEAAWFNLARVRIRLGEKEAGQAAMARYEDLRDARFAAEAKLSEVRLRVVEKLKR